MIVAGTLFLLLALVLCGFHVSTRFEGNPFHHHLSLFLSRWELIGVLAVMGAGAVGIGLGLWRLKRWAMILAWFAAAVLLMRGGLSLAPPIDAGTDVRIAAALILPALKAMFVLRRSASAFRAVPESLYPGNVSS